MHCKEEEGEANLLPKLDFLINNHVNLPLIQMPLKFVFAFL
jgi:hypothetical protein